MRAFLTAALPPCLLVWALASTTAVGAAQFPLPGAAPAGERKSSGDGKAPAAETRTLRSTALDYSEARSRQNFAACDADADDRLDVFEARESLRAPSAPDQLGWFRRLDHDRDGFVDWPEFDRHYRDVVQNGGVLHLKLARPLAEPEGPEASTTPPPKTAPKKLGFDTFDKNRDRKLDAGEVTALLKQIGAPPSVAAMLPLLDRDKDNGLSEAELAPALQQFAPGLFSAPTATATPVAVPPGSFADLDADANGAVTVHELGRALRRVDPQLERWAAAIVQRLDRNGDQLLRATELPSAPGTRPKAMVEAKPGR